MLLVLIQCCILIAFFMTGAFIVSVYKQDNTVADIAWGGGFILIALFTFFKNNMHLSRHILVTTLVILWGIRLGVYLYLRNKGKGEDPRYKAWRQQWGNNALLYSFLYVFTLQGAVMLMVAYPIMFINSSIVPGLAYLDFIGLGIRFRGFIFESVGDAQLYMFTQDAANKTMVMQTGLWRYTRHPNYFVESCMWWGIFIIALNIPLGVTAIISPALITYLLLYVSGIPLLEKSLEKNPEYKEYQKRTSAFIPWIRK